MTDIAYVWIAAGGLLVALITLIVMIQQKTSFERTRRDEHQQEYGKTTEILCGLDKQLATINGKMDASEARLNDIYERVIRTEESVKQAHARIDELRERTMDRFDTKENRPK